MAQPGPVVRYAVGKHSIGRLDGASSVALRRKVLSHAGAGWRTTHPPVRSRLVGEGSG